MVCIGEREKLVAKSSMAVAPEKTAAKPLHNFDLPWLRWGSQRYLRCMKVENSGGGGGGAGGETRRRSEGFRFETSLIAARRESETRKKRKLRFLAGPRGIMRGDGYGVVGEEGIAAVREKLLVDLKKAAAKMKDAIFRDEVAAGAAVDGDDEDADVDEDDDAAPPAAAVGEARPWNLRTRRAACKAPPAPAKTLRIDDRKVNSPSPPKGEAARSPRPARGLVPPERAKFAVGLSRKEIEADFMELLGQKPARRPKKRPKIVQKQLDFLFPGLLLGEITTDTYKVLEVPETGKVAEHGCR